MVAGTAVVVTAFVVVGAIVVVVVGAAVVTGAIVVTVVDGAAVVVEVGSVFAPAPPQPTARTRARAGNQRDNREAEKLLMH